MISRFVLWSKDIPPIPPDLMSPALGEAMSLLTTDLDSVEPASLQFSKRRILGELISEYDIGRELVLHNESQPFWLSTCHQTPLTEMELSVRSFNCLRAASIYTLDDLLSWTPQRLQRLPNFGRRCLDEITSLLDDLGFPSLREDWPFIAGGASCTPHDERAPFASLLTLEELFPASQFNQKLTNCGWRMALDIAPLSVQEISRIASLTAEEQGHLSVRLDIAHLDFPIVHPYWLAAHVFNVRSSFQKEIRVLAASLASWRNLETVPLRRFDSPVKSLTEELERLIPKRYDARKQAVIRALLGLDGDNPLSLEETALRQRPQMTRERIRQIALPFIERLTAEHNQHTWLNRAIECVVSESPCTDTRAEEILLNRAIVTSPLRVTALLKLATRARIMHSITLHSGLVLDLDIVPILEKVVSSARKMCSHWGVAIWNELSAPLGEHAALFRPLIPGATWLGESDSYFIFLDDRNSLANRLLRILHVTSQLALSVAYTAVFRDPRVNSVRLPEDLFPAFCAAWPWCNVEGGIVKAVGVLPSADASSDDLLVILIQEFGRPVTRQEILQRARTEGISESAVNHALSYSNVLASFNGLYSVVGDCALFEASADTCAQQKDEGIEKEMPQECASLSPQPVSMAFDAQTNLDILDSLSPESDDFTERLALIVQRRCDGLKLNRPWSVAELRLSNCDRAVLLDWGKVARWEYRRDNRRIRGINDEIIRSRTTLGLAFLLFAAESVRRSAGSGAVWPSVYEALGEQQRSLFLVQESFPKQQLREAVEEACRVFGLRHDFGEAEHQVWVRTIGMQYGFSLPQMDSLGEVLTESVELAPVAIQMLLSVNDKMYSTSFTEVWETMRRVRKGDISETLAKQTLVTNPWSAHLPLNDLVSACLKAHSALVTPRPSKSEEEESAYSYFEPPSLQWTESNPTFIYTLHTRAPAWAEAERLMFICANPVKKEAILISDGTWRFEHAPLSLALNSYSHDSFSFDLCLRGISQLLNPITVPLVPDSSFAFFRNSGKLIEDIEGKMPLDEPLTLLHASTSRVEGALSSLNFKSILGGRYRLTRLPSGSIAEITLLDEAGECLWPHSPVATTSSETMLDVDLSGGRWGEQVRVALPEVPFVPNRLRLGNGEVISIPLGMQALEAVLTPGMSRAKDGRLHGIAGVYRRSAKVALHRGGRQYGVALEIDGSWRAVHESETLFTSVLRTSRLLAEPRDPNFDLIEGRWMEGSRVIARPRKFGTLLSGCNGLGDSLRLAARTYNNYEVSLCAASAVIDVGELRALRNHNDGSWTANLPFDDPLSADHSLWVWASADGSPQIVPSEQLHQEGSLLRWHAETDGDVFGWALSFRGNRVGSACIESMLPRFAEHLTFREWKSNAAWLRWWQAPVLHPGVRKVLQKVAANAPIDTCAAWLMPDAPHPALVQDEAREDAWASVCREMLWTWRPDAAQAKLLMERLGIWTGDPQHDCSELNPCCIQRLLRCSPILLANAAATAAPLLYAYPHSDLAVLLRLLVEAINPNVFCPGFALRSWSETYAEGENRIDAEFILRSLVGDATQLRVGNPVKSQNLRIAFHHGGLREIIAVSLLLDTIKQWQSGVMN